VVAADLPWSAGRPDRIRIAILSPSGAVSVLAPDRTRPLPLVIADVAAPDAHVLLDIPIRGCAGAGAFRPIDRRLAAAGVPVLPWTAAGRRGAGLARAIRRRLPDATIDEVYPYAVLRVLWALSRTRSLAALRRGAIDGRVEPGWGRWPPRYKRAPTRRGRLQALGQVRRLLEDPALGLAFEPKLPVAGPLAGLGDCYDAALAIVPGLLGLDHPAVYRAGEPRRGAVLLLADAWLRERLTGRCYTPGALEA
jgi:hypothetical protein